MHITAVLTFRRVDLPELNMPRDLSGDAQVDAADHADDDAIRPVLVRVRAGVSSVELKTLIVDC